MPFKANQEPFPVVFVHRGSKTQMGLLHVASLGDVPSNEGVRLGEKRFTILSREIVYKAAVGNVPTVIDYVEVTIG